jgi:hypothetical protein
LEISMVRLVALCFVLVVPWSAEAAISISEVAWMGNSESANHEWIELHNDGAAVNVAEWVLRDGANIEIVLSGTIPADSYVVLERTDEASAPGSAFLLYTGALVNTGATLRLERADGSLVDQVSGGKNWEAIGGDNTTKETAQYTSAGWITAEATPGGPPPAVATQPAEEADNEESDVTEPETRTVAAERSSGSSETVQLTLPDVTLQLAVEGLSKGYVRQELLFAVEPSGIGKHLIDSLSYEWNFGDGSTATGKEVSHVYEYPGTYVLTVWGGFKRQEQVARHEVTVLPVVLSLTTNEAGDVQLNNDSPYEIDISGYKVKGREDFVFPARSIILPYGTITLPQERVGASELAMVAVYDTAAELVASRIPEVLRKEEATVQSRQLAVEVSPAPSPNITPTIAPASPPSTFGFAAIESPVTVATYRSGTTSQSSSSQVAAVAAATSEQSTVYLWLVGILAVAILGLLVSPRRQEQV